MPPVFWWTGITRRWLLFLGVVCAISLAVGVVAYISGEREFPAYSSHHASFGAFLVEIGGTMIVTLLLWRLLSGLRGPVAGTGAD